MNSVKFVLFRYCDSFLISEDGHISLQPNCSKKLSELTLLFDHGGLDKIGKDQKVL